MLLSLSIMTGVQFRSTRSIISAQASDALLLLSQSRLLLLSRNDLNNGFIVS